MKNKLDLPFAILWLLDGRRVPEDDIGFFVQQLADSELRRYDNFKREERKRQFLLGHMLLRFAVSSLTNLSPDALGVVERTGRAPELVFPESQRLRPSFSLSHSREWVACAVSLNVTLGLDIEVKGLTRNVLGISELVFYSNEHHWLSPQLETAHGSAFYELWCTREALYKLMSNVGCEVDLSPLVGADGAVATKGSNWHRYTLSHPGVIIVVCSNGPLSALYQVELPRLTRADWLTQQRVLMNAPIHHSKLPSQSRC